MDQSKEPMLVEIPEDLGARLDELQSTLGEQRSDIVIAAVEHFTRLPEQRQKAVMMGVARRRRG